MSQYQKNLGIGQRRVPDGNFISMFWKLAAKRMLFLTRDESLRQEEGALLT